MSRTYLSPVAPAVGALREAGVCLGVLGVRGAFLGDHVLRHVGGTWRRVGVVRGVGRQPRVEGGPVTRTQALLREAFRGRVTGRERAEPRVERHRVKRADLQRFEVGAVGLGALRRRFGQRHRRVGAPLGRGVARVRRKHGHQRQQQRLGDRQQPVAAVLRRSLGRVRVLVLADLLAHLGCREPLRHVSRSRKAAGVRRERVAAGGEPLSSGPRRSAGRTGRC